MERHDNGIETDVPHLCGAMMSELQMIIIFHALVGAFGSGSGVVGLFPLRTAAGREVVEAGIGFHGDGERPAEFGGRAGRIADAFAFLHTGTAEFQVAALQIRAVGLHVQSGGTDGNAVRPGLDSVGFRGGLFGVAGCRVFIANPKGHLSWYVKIADFRCNIRKKSRGHVAQCSLPLSSV